MAASLRCGRSISASHNPHVNCQLYPDVVDHSGYDHTTSKFDCYSTKATIILTDMTTIEKGP